MDLSLLHGGTRNSAVDQKVLWIKKPINPAQASQIPEDLIGVIDGLYNTNNKQPLVAAAASFNVLFKTDSSDNPENVRADIESKLFSTNPLRSINAEDRMRDAEVSPKHHRMSSMS